MAVGVFQGMAKTVSHVSEHLSAMCPVYTRRRRPWSRSGVGRLPLPIPVSKPIRPRPPTS